MPSLFHKKPDASQPPAAVRLHIGCGQEAIPGWVNIDNRMLPGVDQVLDVQQGLPFQDVEAIYAEHFLEHLPLEGGLALLQECRRVLSPPGVLRLSTPNLDWVFATHYRYGQWPSEEDAFTDCLQLNRAFHGWGHQFLYNRPMLAAVLKAAGFSRITFHRYGESEVAHFKGIERHQTWQDTPDLPHVIVAEASERGRPIPLPRKLFDEFQEAIRIR